MGDEATPGTIKVRVGCDFLFESDVAVPMLMLVRAHADGEHHILYESRWLDPDIAVHEYLDVFGNTCWRFLAPGGELTVRYDASVEVDAEPDPVNLEARLTPVEDLPDEAMVYTLPSRYVESDLLLNTAWELFGSTPPTWARVQAVVGWVHENIRYVGGSSSPEITALNVYERRFGVCRDFALLSVAFCRALNIPARYTFGYFPDIAVEPPDVAMDFHAWFEAYLGGRWYTFDARHNTPRIGRVVIGHGRDAVDVAMSTSYGSTRLKKMTVWSDEVTADNPGGPPPEEDADELEAGEKRVREGDAAQIVAGPV
ncbi:MAG: transglutaminase family protein [Dehalococcoidia bacterium]